MNKKKIFTIFIMPPKKDPKKNGKKNPITRSRNPVTGQRRGRMPTPTSSPAGSPAQQRRRAPTPPPQQEATSADAVGIDPIMGTVAGAFLNNLQYVGQAGPGGPSLYAAPPASALGGAAYMRHAPAPSTPTQSSSPRGRRRAPSTPTQSSSPRGRRRATDPLPATPKQQRKKKNGK